MQLLTRAPTRQYFVSIFVVVTALFFTFSAVIYRQYKDAQRLNEWMLYNYEVVRQSRRILMYLVDMETGVRGYILSGEDRFLEPYENSQKTLDDQIKQLWAYTKNDVTAHESIDIWLKKIVTFSQLLDTQVTTLHAKGNSAFSTADLDNQKQHMDDLRVLLEGYINSRLADVQKQIETSKDQQKNFKYIVMLGTVLAIGGMLLATLVILALIKRSQRAEEEARLVESRFLTVMNGIDDGLYDFNLEDGTIYYSPSYKAMLGYTEEEHPNTVEMFNSTLHPDDYEITWETFRKYQEGETQSYSNTFRLRHKDGNWIWILSRGVGLKDNQGRMIRLLGTHTDITQQKKGEEELKRLNNEMESFTYITSHDLRAPLVNLKGFAGEMQHSLEKIKPVLGRAYASLGEEERTLFSRTFEQDIPESLHFIVQSVEKMDALTTAVLDLSRIGKREYHYESVDTQAIIKRSLETLAYEISAKNIEIICSSLPTVTSDPLALEQIFSNVLDNAVKYLHPDRNGKIIISAKENESQFIFSVRDNGRGIAEADKEKVFQIFRRARNTANVRGRGMGMTFVQATMRQLGGTIWFDSKEEKGTTFYIALPKHLKSKGRIV